MGQAEWPNAHLDSLHFGRLEKAIPLTYLRERMRGKAAALR